MVGDSSRLYLGITETDGLALALLGVMGTAFAVIATLLFCMFRNASKRDPEVDRLIDEMEKDEKEVRVQETPLKAEDWEKDGDWWKRE